MCCIFSEFIIQLQTEFCKSSRAMVTETLDTYGCLLMLLANYGSTDFSDKYSVVNSSSIFEKNSSGNVTQKLFW